MSNPYLVCRDVELRILISRMVHAECWDDVGRILSDVEFSEAAVARLGIDATLGNYDTVLRGLPSGSRWHRALTPIEEFLERESHNLRAWHPPTEPAYFLQHLHNRAVSPALRGVRTKATRLLAERKLPYIDLLWWAERESPALERTFADAGVGVVGIALTTDGRYLVAGSMSGLKLWNLRTGLEEHAFGPHSDWVNSVAVTPDGRFVISAEQNSLPDSAVSTLKVWNLRTG